MKTLAERGIELSPEDRSVFTSCLSSFRQKISGGENLAQRRAAVVTGPLYHYTDAHGLSEILRSDEVWFTDYRHLNDPQELTYGLRLARAAVSGYDATSALERQFLDELAKLTSDEAIINGTNEPEKLQFFVASFSRVADDLGQWRAYGADGKGFSLGVSPSAFAPSTDAADTLDRQMWAIGVTYGTERSGPFAVVLGEATAQIRIAGSLLDRLAPEVSHWFAEQFAREAAEALILKSIASKHSAYKNEEEVRLVLIGQRQIFSKVTRVRTRGPELVPYIARPLPIKANLFQIVAGPGSHPDSVRTTRDLLEENGVRRPQIVFRSSIPYRPRY